MRSLISISACLVLALPALAQSTALNAGPALAGRKPAHEAAASLRAALLSAQAQFVDSSGRVDYRRLQRSPEWARCREQARALQNISLAELSDRASRLAFWANTYNAMVLDGIMSLRIKRSVLVIIIVAAVGADPASASGTYFRPSGAQQITGPDALGKGRYLVGL